MNLLSLRFIDPILLPALFLRSQNRTKAILVSFTTDLSLTYKPRLGVPMDDTGSLSTLPSELRLQILEELAPPPSPHLKIWPYKPQDLASLAASHQTYLTLYRKYKRRWQLTYIDSFLTPAICFARWFNVGKVYSAALDGDLWNSGINPWAVLPASLELPVTYRGRLEWFPRLIPPEEVSDEELDQAAGIHRRIMDLFQLSMVGQLSSRSMWSHHRRTREEVSHERQRLMSVRCVYQSVLKQFGREHQICEIGLEDMWTIIDAPKHPNWSSSEIISAQYSFQTQARLYHTAFAIRIQKLVLERLVQFIHAVCVKYKVVTTYIPGKAWDPVVEVARLISTTMGPVLIHALLYGNRKQATVALHLTKFRILKRPEDVIYWGDRVSQTKVKEMIGELTQVCELLDLLNA